jgi:hypothetical protein
MMRVMPRTAVSRMPPTVAISSATVSEAWTCIHKKVMGTTVLVFWARKTIRPTAMRAVTQIAVHAEAALVSGTTVAATDFVGGAAGPVGVAGAREVAGRMVERLVMPSPFSSTGLVGTLKRNVAVYRNASHCTPMHQSLC